MRYTGLINKYRERLPVSDTTKIIQLGEGNTPLIKLENIPADIGFKGNMYVKYEGLNPTGSFKDRGMTMAVTKAYEKGAKAIICASTGNTSAAAAAYAARAGIKSFVIIPEGKIAMGKLAQAMISGAVVIQIKGNFDDGMHLVKEISGHAPVDIVNSINPHRLQGQKTASFEIIEELGEAPDYHAIPVGNAGNITAHFMGYKEYYNDRLSSTLPRMVGYQAEGSAPFVHNQMVHNPDTIASAIRIGHPQSFVLAQEARYQSNGYFELRTDEEILEAQKLLTTREGIFVEPASATSIAGVIKNIREGKIENDATIVCTVTGHGLKDPDTAVKQSSSKMILVEPTLDNITQSILDNM